jgi:hypothetical protein
MSSMNLAQETSNEETGDDRFHRPATKRTKKIEKKKKVKLATGEVICLRGRAGS